MFSSFVSKRFVVVSILAVMAMQLPLINSVLSLNQTNAYLHHICLNGEGTFKSGSIYEREVKGLIDHLSTYLDYGFVNGAAGDGTDDIYAKFQCRADISTSNCRSCLVTAFSGVTSF